MIYLSSSRGNLPLHSFCQIIIITIRNRGLFLRSTGQRKPNLRPKNRWYPFPNQLLQSNSISQCRKLQRRCKGTPLSYGCMKIPINTFTGLQCPPNSTLLSHLFPYLIQHIHIIHIPFNRKSVKVLKFHSYICSS
ncbi:hypothetical protein MtrunA17_Chr5g0448081 [Medicago truncatula]|uniref:Uncharacterized protein n=1 Tax=Medicago truncatula TaxID=3880 RepID=A0A396I095_MEDTR|nr:hypothetical protein MtrunA17_Chr5g0448081 [Medicago truncatula]